MKSRILVVGLLLMVLMMFACGKEEPVSPVATQEEQAPSLAKQGVGDPAILALMYQINDDLAAQGLSLAVEEIELFTIGAGRPSNRILNQPFRWVPNDARRNAQGDDLTYLIDLSDGATASGLTAGQTEAALDRSMTTWDTAPDCADKLDIVKRADTGADPDIFDAFFGFGGFGNPFLADIVNAGWLPRAFFGAVTGAPDNVLAFSVTFIFLTGPGGPPSDINGDNRLDTALNEVYFNDTFGTSGEPRAGNPWGINVNLPGIDVETVGTHEFGHSFGIGHFGPPPNAVMNPRYAGIRQSLLPPDGAAYCINYGSWPNP